MAEYILKKLGWKDSEGRRHIIDFTGKSSTPTDPEPGSPGYGTGVYKGDDLEESLGLFPMEGTDNPYHDNYGNYQNSDGSIFCFIPKFYYSFDCKPTDAHYNDTLKYSGLTAEQLAQIVTRSPLNYMAFASRDAFKNEAEANTHGFILHRAFIDGGQEKSGFFIAKYLASRGTDGTSTKAMFIKNGKTISLYIGTSYIPSSAMPGCRGNGFDAIILSKAINPNLNCASAFMYGALAMQSKFIGTIVTSTPQCAWYDSNLVMNFPKGCNNNNLGDTDDSSVKYITQYGSKPLTGSGSPFSKTTHNGLNNGVCDLNGCMWQIVIGILAAGGKILKESIKLSNVTTENVGDTSIYDTSSSYLSNPYRWGNSSHSSWRKAINGSSRALEGVYPISGSQGCSTNGLDEFGKDGCSTASGILPTICSGDFRSTNGTGIFRRASDYWDSNEGYLTSFRSGGYALN